ncbi:MAG TPA: cytochrome C oxidase subunit IV family protein [Gemmatimonadales bacterium]|jgi:caa(3)-type oxidase subunit IV|nr:cytochrome C oxidase subunit IV family protein [Gemmatimonadales bacterium]
MEAHVAEAETHSHPTAGLYVKIAAVLFLVTFLEVAAYELSHRGGNAEAIMGPILIPVLLLLSAVKFALVAMFYMHLKQDSKLFTGLFVFPLIIAAVIAVSLMVLMSYHLHYNAGMV